MTKRKTWAWIIMVGPWILLPLTIVAFFVISFILASFGTSFNDSTAGHLTFSIVRVVLGIVGIAAVIGMIVGIPVGAVMLASEKKAENSALPKTPTNP